MCDNSSSRLLSPLSVLNTLCSWFYWFFTITWEVSIIIHLFFFFFSQKGRLRHREGYATWLRWWLVESGFQWRPFDFHDPCFSRRSGIVPVRIRVVFKLCLFHLSQETSGSQVVSPFIPCPSAVIITKRVISCCHYLLGVKYFQASWTGPVTWFRWIFPNSRVHAPGHPGDAEGFEGFVQVVSLCHFMAILPSVWID